MVTINKKFTPINFTDRNTKPKYIVIHYVGAVSTAKNNADYFYRTYVGASAHYFVDETSIWQIVDDYDSSWAVGGGKQSNKGGSMYGIVTNSNSINIEMCVKKDKNGNWYYEQQTLNNTRDLVQYLMNKHGIGASNVYRHFDVVGKSCPANYLTDSAWANFKSFLTGKQTSSTTTAKPSTPTTSGKIEACSGTVTSKINGLAYHSKPDWSDSTIAGTINKGTVLTVVGKIKVNGVYMYKTKAGWYITSATEYVVFKGNSGATTAKKSVTEIAKEVINGKWGNGTDRKNRLEKAGYNYNEVQAKVNELL